MLRESRGLTITGGIETGHTILDWGGAFGLSKWVTDAEGKSSYGPREKARKGVRLV